MDRQSLEVQKDLDLVLGKFDAERLVTMDVRGTVVISLDVHVTVRMQSGVLPVRVFQVPNGQRLEGGFLDRLEAFTAGDAEASVTTRVDPFHAHPERLVDLSQ